MQILLSMATPNLSMMRDILRFSTLPQNHTNTIIILSISPLLSPQPLCDPTAMTQALKSQEIRTFSPRLTIMA
ncbi:hypothetical protein [Helicobacter labetoulli]|uniref:hypothetical protein n=1 Tax=Helicobacter labetoulli TaxID=2315333 RepID=UPI001FC9C0C8|nr:hypothetical protein [Helicobacter labetoulli]